MSTTTALRRPGKEPITPTKVAPRARIGVTVGANTLLVQPNLQLTGQTAHTVTPVRRDSGVIMLAVVAVLVMLAGAGIDSPPASASTESRLAAARAKESALRAAALADGRRAAHFRAPIADLQSRENALQSALQVQQGILDRLQTRLRADRARLIRLRNSLVHDEQVLADQLRASYETPDPDIVTVMIEAHGFAELLERMGQLKAIGRQNAQVTTRVHRRRDAVATQTRRLEADARRQRAVTAAATSERNQVDQLRVALVSRQLVFIRARGRTTSQLAPLRARRVSLERRLRRSRAAAVAAQARAFGGPSSPIGGGGSGVGGGFFPAAGTNYANGSDPQIAQRLAALGKALGLHLIGISGYRSPQHSVEVGGFANDPHTRGAASDTPGVEGVPEATLRRFGLTRPFGGAAEADHIQLAGSA